MINFYTFNRLHIKTQIKAISNIDSADGNDWYDYIGHSDGTYAHRGIMSLEAVHRKPIKQPLSDPPSYPMLQRLFARRRHFPFCRRCTLTSHHEKNSMQNLITICLLSSQYLRNKSLFYSILFCFPFTHL